jgi:hypothetical protein
MARSLIGPRAVLCVSLCLLPGTFLAAEGLLGSPSLEVRGRPSSGGGDFRPADSSRETAASDLDDFMARVLARRDESWKRLQQYVLDERERVLVLAPGQVRLYGLEREYTWFVKEGFFVRSPVRFDGVAISEDDRRAYERRWIQRERMREWREARKRGETGADVMAGVERRDTTADPSEAGDRPQAGPDGAADVLRQTLEPRFVSAANFLRFKFEPGRYALVGREPYEGRETLRIEYYPERLFDDDDDEAAAGEGRTPPAEKKKKDETDARIERQMNKVALITLWVDPVAHQILTYTFDNVGFDFLPGRSLVRVDDARASMRMGEMFPGVWLPRDIDIRAAVTVAMGTFEMRFDVDYENYRQADVKVKVR